MKEVSYKVVRKIVAGTTGKKPGVSAARALAPRHIQQAWARGHIGRENPDALIAAGYLVFTTGLGCRAVEEVTKIPNRAVLFGPADAKYGLPEFIELEEEWVCKNRQGNDPRRLEARIHPDHENPEYCMVRTILEIQRRKRESQKMPDKRFLWNIYDQARAEPKKHEKWFKNCVMGRHTVAKMLINALEKSGIDCKAEKYTATLARKTMLDGGLDAGIPEVLLGRKAGHRTDKSKNSYIQNKDVTHRATNIALSRVGAGLAPNNQEILDKIVKEDSLALAQAQEVNAEGRGLNKDKAEKSVQQAQFLFDEDDEEEEGFGYTISQSRMEESTSVKYQSGGRGGLQVQKQHGQKVVWKEVCSDPFDLKLMGPGPIGNNHSVNYPKLSHEYVHQLPTSSFVPLSLNQTIMVSPQQQSNPIIQQQQMMLQQQQELISQQQNQLLAQQQNTLLLQQQQHRAWFSHLQQNNNMSLQKSYSLFSQQQQLILQQQMSPPHQGFQQQQLMHPQNITPLRQQHHQGLLLQQHQLSQPLVEQKNQLSPILDLKKQSLPFEDVLQKPAVQKPAVQEHSVQKQQKMPSSKENFPPGSKSKDWIGAIMLHKLKGVFWPVKITRMEAGR